MGAKEDMRKLLTRIASLRAHRTRLSKLHHLEAWRESGFSMPAPREVKWATLERLSLRGAAWIESGTYLGETTRFLTSIGPLVISLEPDPKLHFEASQRLSELTSEGAGKILLVNESSEQGFHEAVKMLGGHDRVNFFLDGHWSRGDTHQGVNDTPVLHELEVIGKSIEAGTISDCRIFVDDARLFANQHREDPLDNSRGGYPPLDSLVNWARDNKGCWSIEHDLFIFTFQPNA
jgi:hypothetical protein